MENKTCPFCGNNELTIKINKPDPNVKHTNQRYSYIMCKDCGAQGPKVYYIEEDNIDVVKGNAIIVWNNRV